MLKGDWIDVGCHVVDVDACPFPVRSLAVELRHGRFHSALSLYGEPNASASHVTRPFPDHSPPLPLLADGAAIA